MHHPHPSCRPHWRFRGHRATQVHICSVEGWSQSVPDDGVEAVVERHTEYCAEGTNVHGSHVHHIWVWVDATHRQPETKNPYPWTDSGESLEKYSRSSCLLSEPGRRITGAFASYQCCGLGLAFRGKCPLTTYPLTCKFVHIYKTGITPEK